MVKDTILRNETGGALLHHSFTTQKLSIELSDKLFSRDRKKEELIDILLEGGHQIVEGSNIRLVNNPQIPNSYSAPLKLFVDISNYCNLSCNHCLSDSSPEKKDTLNRATFERIANECYDLGVLYFKIGGGEPLLHPEILTFIDLLNERSLDVSLTTNGTLVKGSMVEELRKRDVKISVSLDGLQENHDRVRGDGSFEKAMRALQSLRQSNARVHIRTTLFPFNLQDMRGLVDIAEHYDVTLKVRRAKPHGRAQRNNLIISNPTPEYYQTVEYLNTKLDRVDIEDIMVLKKDTDKLLVSTTDCGAGTRSLHIDHTGLYSPCIFLGEDFQSGSVYSGTTIRDTWYNATTFRLLRNIKVSDSCNECTRTTQCHNECPAIKLYTDGTLNGHDPACMKDYIEQKPSQKRKSRHLTVINSFS